MRYRRVSYLFSTKKFYQKYLLGPKMLDIIGIYPGNKIWLSFMLCPDPPGFRAARYCFLLLLSCSTWPCLGHAEKHLPAFFHLSWTGYRISSGRSARLWVKKVIPQCNSGILIILTIDRSGPRRQQMRCPLLQLSGDAWGLLPPQRLILLRFV